ncbi:MAG: VCBS repeat-containing protein [Acidobacteria bacterium]|nr:VCBS repeat-containing protein [Acidobacteriota bacterium]
MTQIRPSLRGYPIVLFLVALLGAIPFVSAEDGTAPGETPPLTLSTSTVVWGYDSALWANPDPAGSTITASWLHCESDGWWHHSEHFGVSPLGGSAFKAPVAIAAGRTLDLTRDWYATAFYTTASTGNVVEIRLEGGSKTIRLDAGNGLNAPRKYGDLVLVASDVDGVVEADDSYHDEILVLYNYIQDGVQSLRLTILSHALEVMATQEVSDANTKYLDGVCSDLTTGDVDGDGRREILVGTPAYFPQYAVIFSHLQAYRFLDGVLTAGAVGRSNHGGMYTQPVSLAAGDFNGDGIEDVIMSTSLPHNNPPYYLQVFTFDASLTPTPGLVIQVPFNAVDGWDSILTPDKYRVQLATAWFKDPGTADLYTKRQLVLASTQPHAKGNSAIDVRIDVLNFAGNWEIGSGHITFTSTDSTHYFQGVPDDIQPLPGNFEGTNNTVPFQDLGVFITQASNAPNGRQINFVACKVNPTTLIVGTPYMKWTELGALSSSFPSLGVARMDDGGRSILLGPPTQIIMQDVVTVDYTIEDPPKHVDYLPVNPQDREGEWECVFVSMFPEFSCMYSKEGENYSSHTEQSVSEGGAGLNAKIGADMEVKIHEVLAKETIDASLEASLGFAFQRSIDSADTTYHNYTYSLDQATDRDDIMQYKTRTYTIWRYPVYGYTALNPNTGQEAQGYYDVNYPPSSTATTFMAGLGCPDFYQPVHQNGNVLTYPLQSSSPYTNDLGEFTVPGSTEPLSQFLNDTSITYGVDGSEKNLKITWTGGASGETTQSWTENLSGDIDFKISFSTKMFGCLKAGIDGEIALQADGSWSQITTDENESSNTGGLSITVPAMHGLNSSQIYSFTPYVYFSKSGNNKVRHAVTIPGTSAWWVQHYNGLPDPGLNLPNHFQPIWNEYTDDWDEYEVDESDMGKRMRGLFLQTAEPAEATGEPMDVTHAVTDGTALTVTARVYNFSFKACATPFDVKFEYVPVNEADFESGPRVTIGTVRVPSMNPQEVKEVSVPWNTTGLGPASASMSNLYRIWVTVDAGNEVNANHPRGSVCDNKEGYWPWNGGLQIYGAAKAGGPVRLTSDAFFPKMRLGLRQTDGTLHTGWGTAPQGEWSKLGAVIHADVLDRRTLHVVFRDWVLFSDKAQKPLAYKLVQGVSWKGHDLGHVGHTNLDWRPLEPGVHFIRAEFANTSLPFSNLNFPFEDYGANLLVWVPSSHAAKDLDYVNAALDEVDAGWPWAAGAGVEEYVGQLRLTLEAIREEARTRLLADRRIQ